MQVLLETKKTSRGYIVAITFLTKAANRYWSAEYEVSRATQVAVPGVGRQTRIEKRNGQTL